LEGPAYFVSHGGEAFPSLTMVLQGDGVTVQLVGQTLIKGGITSSKFETVPDVPFSSFELDLPEGPDAVLGAITNLCKPTKSVTVRKRVTVHAHGRRKTVMRTVTERVAEPLVMPTTITAQDGVVLNQSTKIAVTGCPKARANAAKRGKRRAVGR
jgi:hypothetical protein